MGEGERRLLREGSPGRHPQTEPAGTAPGVCRPAQEPESRRAQSPEPASERLSPRPLLPSPSQAAQPEPVPGGGRRGGVPHPARFSDTRAPAPRPRRPALLLWATTPRTQRCPGRSFARLTYRGKSQSLSPTLAARPRL